MKTLKCIAPGCTKQKQAKRRECKHHRYMRQYYGSYEKPVAPTYSERFWSKVRKTDRCWEWGAGQQHEYGTFWDGSRSIRAHRFAFEDLVRKLRPGEILDHACRNPMCVRPHEKHVRLASCKLNMENLLEEGRNSQTGIRGVTYSPRNQKYMARVGHNGRMLWLGYHDTLEEARAVVLAKRLELFTYNELDHKHP